MYVKMVVSASRIWLFELSIFRFWTVDQAQRLGNARVCLYLDVFRTCWSFKNIICGWIARKQLKILVSFSPVVFIWFAGQAKGADWSMICQDIVEKHPSLLALSINPSVSHFYQGKKKKPPNPPSLQTHHIIISSGFLTLNIALRLAQVLEKEPFKPPQYGLTGRICSCWWKEKKKRKDRKS